jgi:FlaA1/EpsC-like NDP-sugar epimerase
MKLAYRNHPNLHFVIGDIRDVEKLSQSFLRTQPTIIIIAAALKHIDKCEYETHECISTNLGGTTNVIRVIEMYRSSLSALKSVCFVSTDKACSPVNIYGMCKAASECCMVEASKNISFIKFITVRYGNVLNSRGSIIPILHQIGRDIHQPVFHLTDPKMTRFVMTLEQSVDLITHALLKAESGVIVIPQLTSMNIKDLMTIFSQIYQKPVVVTGLRPGEKILESLINATQSTLIVPSADKKYLYIKPFHSIQSHEWNSEHPAEYNSLMNPLSYSALYDYLDKLGLLHIQSPESLSHQF